MNYEHARSVAEVAEVAGLATVSDPVAPEQIERLAEWLHDEVARSAASWTDRPASPLRVTKGRMRVVAICPAQILGELEPFQYGPQVALGVVCDVAAGLCAVHRGFAPASNWYDAVEPVLQLERPEVVDYIESLDPDSREFFMTDVDERCSRLPALLGDLSTVRLAVHERIRVGIDQARVELVGEPDLTVGTGGDVLVEVKSGAFGQSAADEVRHYALLKALRDRRLPRFGCVLSLRDDRVIVVPIRFEEIEAGAHRLVESVEKLIDVDTRIADGRTVPTRPDAHCGHCPRLHQCPDANELAVAGLPARDSDPTIEPDIGDNEPW